MDTDTAIEPPLPKRHCQLSHFSPIVKHNQLNPMNIILYLHSFFTIFKMYKSSCEDNWPSCDGLQNIVCERGGQCNSIENCTMINLDEKFRRLVLEEHNKIRNNVAQGQETRGGNGEAANMMVLSYDLALEYTAACKANQCGGGFDDCRRTKNYTAGQNMDTSYTTVISESDDEKQIQRSIQNWYGGVVLTSEDVIKAFSIDIYIEYTQLVWAETTRIGCARSNDAYTYYLVCNYGNAGNIPGSPVYEKGEACSKCPPGVFRSDKYKALCGKIEDSELTSPPLSKGGSLVSSHLISLGVPSVLVSFKTFARLISNMCYKNNNVSTNK
ncbi:hypothetical protein JTB14_009479 [Gonioctena quinquepunctata]|nr:hypothetical protein JTB14_009479 [Gonioctena quinquepunctata]